MNDTFLAELEGGQAVVERAGLDVRADEQVARSVLGSGVAAGPVPAVPPAAVDVVSPDVPVAPVAGVGAGPGGGGGGSATAAASGTEGAADPVPVGPEPAGGGAGDGAGRHGGMIPADPEPWPDPVDGNHLIEEITGVIARHTVIEPRQRVAIALWCLWSYEFDLFRHSPNLAIQSPTKRCGKSTLLILIAALGRNTEVTAGATGPSLFRLIDEKRPTLLLDEADFENGFSRDLRVLFNAAHTKETAFISRVVSGVTVNFNTFCPKVVASIGSLPVTVQDRSIVIRMRRRRADEPLVSLPLDSRGAFLETRRRIARWTKDHRMEIGTRGVAPLPGLNSRAMDNWRPLLSVAEVLGPEWKERAEEAAIFISRTTNPESVDPHERLIQDVKRVLDAEDGAAHLSAASLHAKLLAQEHGFWAEFEGGRSMTQNRLGRILGSFGIASSSSRVSGGVHRVYARADFEDTFSRYCPAEGALV